MIRTVPLTGYKKYQFNSSLINNKDLLLFLSSITVIILLCNPVNCKKSENTTEYDLSVDNTTNSTLLELSYNNNTYVKKTNDCSISLTEFIINFYLQPIICFIGFILNVLNVIIFCGPQFSGAAYAYMIAMSIADAITLFSYLPSGLVR
ncbi:unnamed protein product [Trichobilharzia regenti]|nr:unnamed protein product [Trichobilharzia regenti]